MRKIALMQKKMVDPKGKPVITHYTISRTYKNIVEHLVHDITEAYSLNVENLSSSADHFRWLVETCRWEALLYSFFFKNFVDR